jgi:large subunit ribosomal protein L22
MTGPKLNEGATIAGERAGTKASARYLRTSARKAREVLNLIRGLDVRRADQVLQFTERAVARDIRKVLASAVANAVHNDQQDADELFVLACYADEGPTLRRFRPRARGRATRIRKRSCHITIVVARMSDERLEIVRAREAAGGRGGRPTATAASRRARVERSRQRAAAARAAASGEGAGDAEQAAAAEAEAELEAAEAEASAAAEVEEVEEVEAAEVEAAEGAEVEGVEAAEVSEAEEAAAPTGVQPGPYPGSALPDDDGNAPAGYEIKGNEQSRLYHTPDSRYYKATRAEVYFDSVESAEAAGFTAPSTGTGGESSDEEDGQ